MRGTRIVPPPWYPDWSSDKVVIVGSGPSAIDAPIGIAKGAAKVVAINDSWRLVPWADLLYACDGRWWRTNGGMTKFEGLKVTSDLDMHADCLKWGIHFVRCNRQTDTLVMRPGVVGWGGNSGFQALNLAVQFGARHIILVGLDMHLSDGIHWHPPRDVPLHDPSEINIKRWRRAIDGLAPSLKALGANVINCSPTSALTSYPKQTLQQALELPDADECQWG